MLKECINPGIKDLHIKTIHVYYFTHFGKPICEMSAHMC
jgi:hypothetical protein